MNIIYSDRELAVIIKPVGMDSEHQIPAAIIEKLGGEVFPIHRLDLNVGGKGSIFSDGYRSARVAAMTALMVCRRFSASSKTIDCSLSKTSSVTSMAVRPNFSWI